MIGRLKRLTFCGLFGIAASCMLTYFVYQDKKAYWQETACRTFRTMIVQELLKRDTMNIYFATECLQPSIVESVDLKEEPIEVSLQSQYGTKKFAIPFEKHTHNIVRSSEVRLLHTVALESFPFVPDSLNLFWTGLLMEDGFPGQTAVRVSVSDWWEHEQTTCSDDSSFIARCDSIVSCYLGYRCEVGATGYVYLPWWHVHTPLVWLVLCVVVLGCCLLGWYWNPCMVSYFTRFKKDASAMATAQPSSVYLLEEGFSFDTDSGELHRGDTLLKLTPTLARLLRAFLEADRYTLSSNEILDSVWPEGNVTPGNVHTAIKRLRAALAQISDWTVVNTNLCYQLKKSGRATSGR